MISSLAVWVGIEGIVGVLRLRLQLIPDPPFLSLGTFTFMGQPKVNLSCMPMFKHGLNIMNLPIISSFVQSSVDAAIAKYVAPKSLTLDIKDIIMAEDFKKDTSAHGVVVVRIKRATGFKGRDTGLFRLKKGSADPYVSVGWTKFGKSVWATRVIVSEMEPIWEETGFIIIGPKELNAQERLSEASITLPLRVRDLTLTGVQIWGSNPSATDDDLGFIDIGLNEVMRNPCMNGKMRLRRDTLHKLSTKEDMQCTLDWSLGYFSKRGIQPTQLATQSDYQGASIDDPENKLVVQSAIKEVREAWKDESYGKDQQKPKDPKVKAIELEWILLNTY